MGSALMVLLEVGPLEHHQLRAVMRIDAAAYPEAWSKRLWLTELERSDPDHHGDRIYLAAEFERTVVGFAGALLADGDLHLVTIATAPAHTRSGIGSRLLHEVIERGLAMGAHALTLEVRASNHGAQALYRRFGLAPVGIRKGYYDPDGEDAIIMWADDITTADYRRRLDTIAETFPTPAADPCGDRPIEANAR